MTVHELRKALKKLPDEMPVWIMDGMNNAREADDLVPGVDLTHRKKKLEFVVVRAK